MNKDGKNRKLMIVIEETGEKDAKGDDKFIVYLDGDKERIGKTDVDHLSPAEFWGFKLFQICAGAMTQAGALDPNIHGKGRH